VTRDVRMDLSGAWELAFDDAGIGLRGRWFDPDSAGHARAPWRAARVPGAFAAPGGGSRHPGGEHAVGWYRRVVRVPAPDRSLRVRFAAAERAARVWWNGREVGAHVGGAVPFEMEVTGAGASGLLVVRVENRERGFRPFATLLGPNFAGIWQGVEARPGGPVAIEDLRARTRARPPSVDLEVLVRNRGGAAARFTLHGEVRGAGARSVSLFAPAGSTLPVRLPLEVTNPVLWDPDRPHLYSVEARVEVEGEVVEVAAARVGFREVSIDGNRLLLNGRPLELRAALHWGWYPDLLAPAPDAAAVRSEFALLRSLGFNGVKPCLVVFPPEFYDAADEEGMLVWQEYPNWQVRVNDTNRAARLAEYREMARALRHHPSIVLSSLACEYDKRLYDEALMEEAFAAVKEAGPAAPLLDNSGGWGGEPPRPLGPSRHAEFFSAHPYPGSLRGWNAGSVVRSTDRPYILGETADADTVKEPSPLVSLSRRQALVYRKALVESFRAVDSIRGYVVTHLHDVRELGSGLVDAALRPKWKPEEFLPWNGDVVLLARFSPDRRSFRIGERVEVEVLCRNGSRNDLSAGVLRVVFPDGVAREERAPAVEAGTLASLARFSWTAAGEAPAAARIAAALESDGLHVSNDWNVWLFPSRPAPSDAPEGVLFDDGRGALREPGGIPGGTRLVVASVPSRATREWVRDGGRLLLLGARTGPRRPRFFRRESVTAIARHPALGDFPHDGFPDLQFVPFEPTHAFDLEGEPGATPILERVDARTGERDAWVLEARCGAGALLAAASDLAAVAGGDPAAEALSAALIRYALSDTFDPRGSLTESGASAWLEPDLYVERPSGRLWRRGPFLRDWRLCGPFENRTGGWRAAWPPEAGFDPAARYADGYGGTVGWRRVRSSGDFVDFAEIWPEADRSAAYAFAALSSAVETEADLWIGSDDGERAWWNGDLVLDRSDHREPRPDQDRARIRVRRGENRLLLRICDANHRPGFYCRLAVPDGVALPGSVER